jgi:myo-inositol-1(or 4)-monophosphatase
VTGTVSRPPASAADSRHLAAVAAEAATAVAGDLRAAFRGVIEVGFKRDEHDPVTEHDRRAEERIREVLLAAVPDSTVVGEEGGRTDGDGHVAWYVDPIDGTANFARGLAFFCTSIGAVLDGRVVAGAILDPIAGHLFTADLEGARLGDRPLVSAGRVDEAGALLICSYPNARDVGADGERGLGWYADLVTRYGTVRRPGSAALSLAHVAAGWADAALGTSVSAWDVCAARLLVTRAGGHYRPFGGEGWDQPRYVAHTADLDPVALRGFVAAYQAGRSGDGAW